MTYSRFLYTESHASLSADKANYRYAVLSTPQPHTPALGFRKSIGLQRLAIIWSEELDLRVITFIEEALVARVLSPIKVLRAEKGRLDIIIDQELSGDKLKAFVYALDALVEKVSKNEWSLVVLTEGQETSIPEEASILRSYNCETLQSAKIGILDYSSALSLTNDKLQFQSSNESKP